jgi:hypothetical protein
MSAPIPMMHALTRVVFVRSQRIGQVEPLRIVLSVGGTNCFAAIAGLHLRQTDVSSIMDLSPCGTGLVGFSVFAVLLVAAVQL